MSVLLTLNVFKNLLTESLIAFGWCVSINQSQSSFLQKFLMLVTLTPGMYMV